MNSIISNINTSSVKELNTVLALLLHKGHGKSKTSDRAYRTISTCPVIAKGLDMYIHDLFIDLWNSDQADTQYQGEGSSHELASLMITEATQHSLYSSKKPLYMLFMDAHRHRVLNQETLFHWHERQLSPVTEEQTCKLCHIL